MTTSAFQTITDSTGSYSIRYFGGRRVSLYSRNPATGVWTQTSVASSDDWWNGSPPTPDEVSDFASHLFNRQQHENPGPFQQKDY